MFNDMGIKKVYDMQTSIDITVNYALNEFK